MNRKLNSNILHFELESLIRNVSLDNFKNSLLINKEIITKSFNTSENKVFFKNKLEKYFNIIISEEVIKNTFFEDLSTNIFYHNNDYSVDKKVNMNKVMDIDFSFYASDKIKEYMFYMDFLSEYYRNLAELKSKKYILKDEIYEYNFNTKIRIIQSGVNNFKYLSVSKMNDTTTLNKNYIDMKFKLNKINDTLNLTNIDNPSLIFKNIQIENDLNNKYTNGIKLLFSNIIITNELSIEKKPDYNHLIGLSYKYKFYRLLLNYFVTIIYYYYIKYNDIKDANIKYSEINIILENYKIVLENHTIELIKLIKIMESVDINDRKLESDRIEESENYKKSLKEINKKLDLKQINLFKIKNELTYFKNKEKNSKIVFITSIIVLIISLIVYFSTINYKNINSSKITSILLLLFIISTYFILNYIINIKIFENFELVSERNIDTLVNNTLDIQDMEIKNNLNEYSNELKKNRQDLIKNMETIKDVERIETINDGVENKYYNKTSEDIKTNIFDEIDKYKQEYDESKENYAKDMVINENIDEVREKQIERLESQLISLNSEYDKVNKEEKQFLSRKIDLEETLDTVSTQLDDTYLSYNQRSETIAKMDDLLVKYKDITEDLTQKSAEKARLIELKRKTAKKISDENSELAIKIRDKYKELGDNQEMFSKMERQLKNVISKIEEMDIIIDNIEAQTLQEQANAISVHTTVQTAISNYYITLEREVESTAKIARLDEMIQNEDLEIQKWSKKIIQMESDIKRKAQESENAAKLATENAEEALLIIREKIQKIKDEINNKPKPIILKIDLNLNYELTGNIGSDKRNIFKNNILSELSNTTLVSLNRFEIINIEQGSIIITIKIYPNKSYDNRQKTHYNIADELIKQANSNENTPLRLSKYLRFIKRIGIRDDENSMLTDKHNISFPLNYDYESIGYKIKENGKLIENILKYIVQIENLDNNNITYYDEINPHLIAEVKKFKNLDIDKNTIEKLLNSNYNISKHSVLFQTNLSKLFIYISLLIGIIFLLQNYFYNNIGTINLFGIIVFIILIIIFFIKTIKPVRSNYKKNYWETPTMDLRKLK